MVDRAVEPHYDISISFLVASETITGNTQSKYGLAVKVQAPTHADAERNTCLQR